MIRAALVELDKFHAETGFGGRKMIAIRFPDLETKRRALGFLAGRYSFTTYSTGEVLVSDSALSALAYEHILFKVEGTPTYGQAIPALRYAVTAAVQ